MSGDLIERAAARLSGKRGPVAEAMPESRPAVAILQRTSSADSPARGVSMGDTLTGDAPDARMERAKHGPSRRISLDPAALSRAGIMTPESDSTRIVEEFRVIKLPLLTKAFPPAMPGPDRANVILVTSARPGEGKSFVACNLAMSIASDRNRQVVLVDADLRSTSMSRLLGLPPGPGLIDLLTSPQSDVFDVMLGTNFPNLFLLPTGHSASQSTELLGSPRMAAVVRELATSHDDRIVILDAAPLLVSSEPAVLAHNAGQVLLVVEAERTGRHAVEEALGHLGGCANIGLVLNKARSWLGDEQFGAYYGQKHA
jgi:exopolysaccharide/PEP-CTERM locus tyrosine autokinase